MDVISVVQTLCPVLAKADRLEDRLDVILVGSSRNVVVRGNTEYGHLLGLPPAELLVLVPASICPSAKQRVPSDKYFQRVTKNTACSAKKAPNNSTPSSFMDSSILKQAESV